jgi:hypothetical protein
MAVATAQNGFFDRFWPSLITNEGQINHDGMIRRVETFLGLMLPGSAVLYTALECSHCPHSGIITLLCSISVPLIFCHIEEYRAESAFAKVEAVRKEQLPASQAPAQPVISSAHSSVAAEPVPARTLTPPPQPTMPPAQSSVAAASPKNSPPLRNYNVKNSGTTGKNPITSGNGTVVQHRVVIDSRSDSNYARGYSNRPLPELSSSQS